MEKKEKFLCRVTFYFLIIFLFSSFQSLSGNSKINSFYKSKNILFEIHNKNPVTFYCNCLYLNKKQVQLVLKNYLLQELNFLDLKKKIDCKKSD